MTVGEYPSIFSYCSLLTPSHSCNFTLQTPRVPYLGTQPVGGSGPPPSRRSFDTSCAGGSLVWARRRFLGLDAVEVPQPACLPNLRRFSVGGPSGWARRRFLTSDAFSAILGLGRIGGSAFPCLWASADRLFLHTLSTTRRFINISLFSGSSARNRTEVLWVKDILRRFRGRRFLGLKGILRRYQRKDATIPQQPCMQAEICS